MTENPICKKLRIKESQLISTFNAPNNFEKNISPLPAKTKVKEGLDKNADSIHLFVKNKSDMEKNLNKISNAMSEKTIVWIYYPKGSSGIQTDLTRDKGWDELMKHNYQWLALVSFDDTWSAFSFRLKTDADVKKEAKPIEREIFKWADSATKTIKLPEEISAAFKKNKKASEYFHSLAFSHKREYIEYIVGAKKQETRKRRVDVMMDMLNNKRKNPADRKEK